MNPRKSFLLAATTLSLAHVGVRADYPSAVLSDGPAAYYRLNDSQTRSAININSGSLGAAANATNDLPTGVVKSVPGAIVGDSSRASFFDFTTRTEIPFNSAINPGRPTVHGRGVVSSLIGPVWKRHGTHCQSLDPGWTSAGLGDVPAPSEC